ncbi:MAG: polysaccharide deacetylase family protein [Myxococcota bacterium]
MRETLRRLASKQTLATWLDRTGAGDALVRARRWGTPWLTAVTYHRIGPPDDAGALDPETFDARAEQFERQIRYLREHHTPVSLSDLRRYLDGASLPPNPVFVSFDDGYRECLTTARPILDRYGVKATFFVATAFTEDRRLPWWDRLALLIRRRREPIVNLERPYPMRIDLRDEEGARQGLLVLIKTHYGLDLEGFLADLGRAAGARLPRDEERALVDRHLCTWDELRALKAAGHDLQSHTHTHRVLHTLAPDALREELARSQAILTERVGGPVDAIAYPVGYPVGGAHRIRRALAATGYRLGFSNNSGANAWGRRPDRFDIRRVAADASFSDAWFRSFMALPPLAYRRLEPHGAPSFAAATVPAPMDAAPEAE